MWNTLCGKTAVIIRVSISHNCSRSGPGYLSGTSVGGGGVQGGKGCTGKRGVSVHQGGILRSCSPPFNHLYLGVCCVLPFIGSAVSSVEPLYLTIVKLWIQAVSWGTCLITRSRSSKTMETGRHLTSKRCHPRRRSRQYNFGHSWIQQTASRLLGKRTDFQRHTIQLKLVIKAESLAYAAQWKDRDLSDNLNAIPKSILHCGYFLCFYEYLLSSYYVPKTVIGLAGTVLNKTKKNCLHKAYIVVGEADNKQNTDIKHSLLGGDRCYGGS